MKKLLVLMLVLGVTSLANAGMVYITGPTEIECGTTETYTVMYSGSPDIIGFDVEVCPSGDCECTIPESGVTIVAENRNTEYDYIGAAYMECEFTGVEVAAASDATALGTTWFTFDLVAPVECSGCHYCDYVTLTLYDVYIVDTDWNQVHPDMGTFEVHCVPEPATMLLLGLGGLFLRRRK